MNNTRLKNNPLPPEVVETALQSWAQAGKRSKFSVTGNSMYPFLLPDDTLLITHGGGKVRPGDLLAFRKDRTLIVHRLLQIRNENNNLSYLIKGDNCTQPDPLIPANQIVGRVRAIQRGDARIDLDGLGWRIASRSIAACARLGLAIDLWGRRTKQQLAGPSPNSLTTFLRRTVQFLFSIPGRVLSWILWSKS